MYWKLYGELNAPKTWEVSEVVKNEAGSLLGEFETYRDCRKWVLTELRSQRRQLGKLMEKWSQVPEEYKELSIPKVFKPDVLVEAQVP